MSGREYAYYPGCSLHATGIEFDNSTRLVSKSLGIQLREIDDWSCCGASSAHATSHLLSLALPARNLALAEQLGLPVTSPCPECIWRLRYATLELQNDHERARIEHVIEREFHNSVPVEPLVNVLGSADLDVPVKKPLTGLRAVVYYGCLIARPKAVTDVDDQEDPRVLDQLLVRLGAESVDWDFKTECCGASLALGRPDIVRDLSYRILSSAKRLDADCIVVACQMCQANLDTKQKEMEAYFGDQLNMPIIYFTQLMGLAMGLPWDSLMFDKHMVDPRPLLREKQLI
ncbi:MAG: heterodisulfide reductase subunit B [Chloroflexota bacterium]|nr:MAG: heterodisulfide reductase subunit B [Chloroflexota bacterium]